MKKSTQINKYEGGNEIIDRYIEDEEVWIVNASAGRKIVLLPKNSTKEEAWKNYEERFTKKQSELV